MLVLYGGFGLSFALFLYYERFGLSQVQGTWAALAMVTLTLVATTLIIRLQPKNENGERYPLNLGKDSSNDALIASYHQMTVRQSTTSFRNSQIAMAIGLTILTLGAVTVIRASDTASQLVLGGLAAMGSAFSGYMSATFLRAHERALQQVNYLFSQPLVSHYLQYSREVASELSTIPLRDRALGRVIDRSLSSAGIAVMTPSPSTPDGAERTAVRKRKTPAKSTTKPVPHEQRASPAT